MAGEFADDFGDIRHPACAAMLARFDILEGNGETAHQYTLTTRLLRAHSQLIGANDHWIAAAALARARAMPLVTSNAARFSRSTGFVEATVPAQGKSPRYRNHALACP